MKHSSAYTFGFSLIVCIVAGTILALSSFLLQPFQYKNEELNRQKNLLKTIEITYDDDDKLMEYYGKYIKRELLDPKTGMLIPESKDSDRSMQSLLVDYNSEGAVNSYILPIEGKGLWSTIKGYLAMEPDGETVKGITFYSHGETPGLGAEIEEDWFTNQFKGKKIVDNQGVFVSVTIKKNLLKKHPNFVDAISGATMTTDGINIFLKKDLLTYEPFFSRLRDKLRK